MYDGLVDCGAAVHDAAVDHDVHAVYWHCVPPLAVQLLTLVQGLLEVKVWHTVAEATV